ncbi:hypothetical protein A4G20_10555 [Pasteurellaceae bacterium RH1A]|nr:hypothetical protein A4G20_10555 [Pasteurellaceae bacterium RH1A]
MQKSTALTWFYVLFLLILIGVFGLQVKQGGWLQTDLRALLPEDQSWQAVQLEADRRQEEALNSQLIALVGHPNRETSFELAAQTAQDWQTSGLFEQVFGKIQPDLDRLRAEIKALRLATLPQTVRDQLLSDPTAYFQTYAQQIINPFEQANLLPLEQDWLGLGRFVLPQSQLQSQVQWDMNSGMLFIENQGKTWVVLRGILGQADLINPSEGLSDLLAKNRQKLTAFQVDFLATGSALFAAQAKAQAEKESTLMSILGISLTLLLLLTVFRSLRVLWLFLPIGAGMLAGIVATVALMGQIHILTLVIGTSLIGVLIDFPLHWLTGSLFKADWDGREAMRKLRFTFLISLLVTLLGYGLLGFTSLPVLQQTALFSAVALLVAMGATLLFLPKLCRVRVNALFKPIKFTLPKYKVRSHAPYFLLVLFIAGGLYQSKWQDDIRDWVAMPENLLKEAQQIGQLTGIDLGSRYFLLTAENDEALLTKDKALSQRLAQEGIAFQSLSQWIMPEAEQVNFATALNSKVQPEDYAILGEIGLPLEAIEQDLQNLTQTPPLALERVLNTELGQAWKSLYLGEFEGRKASIIKISGTQAVETLPNFANNQDIFWQDKRAHLNHAFQSTRDQAAWLKLASFLLAGLLLWRYFGLKRTATMISIPLSAIVMTVALFGWLGLPISLFTMFGLLLVSAIGIDYTAYLQTAQEPLYAKRTAVTLAAATTLISFLLLGLSSTPAVASFGLSVSCGVVLSVLISFRFLR